MCLDPFNPMVAYSGDSANWPVKMEVLVRGPWQASPRDPASPGEVLGFFWKIPNNRHHVL